MLTVVDLFCGLGGFSQAFRDRGHRVIGVDIVPPSDVLADVRALPFNGKLKPDVVLASPPCQEFTKAMLPFRKCRENADPGGKGMDLVRAGKRAIDAFDPRWWVLENVVGSVPHISPLLGRPVRRLGSRFLWGDMPLFLMADDRHLYGKMKNFRIAKNDPTPKEWHKGNAKARARDRSKIPYEISLRLCEAMEKAR